MDKIEQLYNLYLEKNIISEAITLDQFRASTPEQQKKLYGLGVDEGLFQTTNEETFSGAWVDVVKKKDDSTLDQEDIISVSETGPSELSPLNRNQNISNAPVSEKDTAIERYFGKNEVTDFFGDLWRAGSQGLAQGATVDDALALFGSGQDISDEDLAEYIQAVENMESFGPSEEMQDFTKIYEKEGKGIFGFLKGVGANPTVMPQLFTSSIAAMLNKGSLAAGAAGAGVGAGLGAVPGAIIGGIAGVSGALETGLSYTEFLKEQLGNKEFNKENVRDILSDPEAMQSIKNRALARGLTIASIDAVSGGLATSVTRKVATRLGSKALGVAAGVGTEALGGATGETAARVAAGQELDVAEIGFEGTVGGVVTAPLTVGRGLMKPASYKLNDGTATRKEVQKFLSTATPDQIAKTKIGVKNDPDLYQEAEILKSDAILGKEIEVANPGISSDDKAKLLVLEKARSTLSNSSLKSAKNNLLKIDEKIDAISKKYLPIENNLEEATESLALKGIDNPTQEQITQELDLITNKKLKDADTIESTTEVLDGEQSELSQAVDEGDNKSTELAGETSQTQEETTVESTQESEIQQDKKQEVREVTKENDGVTTTNFEKTIKGKTQTNALAPSSILDEYKIDSESAESLGDNKITGVLEIRTDQDGNAAATVQVLDANDNVDTIEIKLNDKTKGLQPKVIKLVTDSRRIDGPFIVPSEKTGKPTSTQINFTSDGKIESVTNRKSGKPVTETTRKKAEQVYLRNFVDITGGKVAPENSSITEDQIAEYISEESNNVKEVTEALVASISENKAKRGERKQIVDAGLFSILQAAFTTESWFNATGVMPGGMSKGFTQRWIRTKKKGGKNIEDGFAGFTRDQVVEFIQNNQNEFQIESTLKTSEASNDVIILREKFKLLTGLDATPSNISTVLSLSDQEPLSLTKDRAKAQATERSSQGDPKLQKGRGIDPNLITKGQPTQITTDELKTLTDQIKLEARAARESKGDQTQRRRSLSEAIKSLKGKGFISEKVAKILIEKVSTVNLNNFSSVQKVLSYVEKVFTKADYDSKIISADQAKKSIKKLSKSENLEPSSELAAKEFLKIDPLLVEDIDAYLNQAKIVKDGITPTKPSKGVTMTKDVKGNIVPKTSTDVMPALDLEKINKYTKAELLKQDRLQYAAQQEYFEELTGLSSDELSLQDMREIVDGFQQDQTAEERAKEMESMAVAKEKTIKDGLKKAFDTVSTLVDSLLKTNKDPITGETIDISEDTKKLVKNFLQIEVDKMTPSDAALTLDSLINFATNQTTGNMGRLVATYKGSRNSKEAVQLGLAAKTLASLTKRDIGVSRAWNKWISSLPQTLEAMFKGQSRALLFQELSGFAGVKEGAAKGITNAAVFVDDYYKEFFKKTANKEEFNTASNDVERGMFAFVRRSIEGEEQLEFERRKALVKESIDELSRSDDDKKTGEVYQKVYDKILADSNNPSEVQSKTDPINVEAVEWVTNEWAKRYPKLAQVNLEYYNKILDQNIKYTPDSISLVKSTGDLSVIGDPIFDIGKRKVVDKKTGVLMEATRPSKLPKDRVLNLAFDSQNAFNIEKAEIDMNTVSSIQQLKSFLASEEFKSIVPNNEDRNLLNQRIVDYVEAKRGRTYTSKNNQKLLKILNNYAGFGVSRTLGGIFQVPKQTIPVLINTIINAGVEHIGVIGELATSPSMQKWLKNSGYSIVNRGIESTTNLESTRNKIDNAANGPINKTVNLLGKLQRSWLENFLVKPDRYAAQASFMMYYLKRLGKVTDQNTFNIDWNTHELNKEAADYAQQQVDRQQNVTDTDLQGEIFKSKNIGIQIIRKAILPFSNFLLNQKTRMYNDITTLSSKTSTVEDKQSAARSMAGLIAETVAFQGLGLLLTQALSGLSAENEDKRKEKQKKFENRKKGRGGQVIKDILSPLPIAQIDGPVILGVNALIAAVSQSKDPYQFFEDRPEGAWERVGLITIPKQKLERWNEYRRMAMDGTYMYKGPFGKAKVKKLSRKGKEDMMANWLSYTLYSLGLAPAEVGTVVDYNAKFIKKKYTRR